MDLPIVYSRETESPKSARLGNASQGGLLLCLDEQISPGDCIRIQMHLTDPKASRILEAVGRIVWVSPERKEDGSYHAGFAFEEITEGDLKTIRGFEALWLEQAG
jgi:Tfp pilus assembly protein PilZ